MAGGARSVALRWVSNIKLYILGHSLN